MQDSSRMFLGELVCMGTGAEGEWKGVMLCRGDTTSFPMNEKD